MTGGSDINPATDVFAARLPTCAKNACLRSGEEAEAEADDEAEAEATDDCPSTPADSSGVNVITGKYSGGARANIACPPLVERAVVPRARTR